MQKSQIGLIGLGVMGQNLTLNMEDKGYSVSVYNRTASKTEKYRIKKFNQLILWKNSLIHWKGLEKLSCL